MADRMMADVPKADVIVTNPTHYAVALQYSEDKMSGEGVAKGRATWRCALRAGCEPNSDAGAPPLARALYRHSDLVSNPGRALRCGAEVLAGLSLNAGT